jgi:transcriptional regulator GlxA family with amidase domain
MHKINVGILIFDGVEVLDFAGPFEVFSRTRLEPGIESRRTDDVGPFRVFTVAQTSAPIVATGGLRVLPTHDFATAPPIDILVVPGGFGSRSLLEHPVVLDWIRQTAMRASHVTSVCTGSLLLAATGLLHGRRATTHWGALELLAALDPTATVEKEVRVVNDGVITSAGISAGIDMAFAVVESLYGQAVADETAHYMEYRRLRVRDHDTSLPNTAMEPSAPTKP